MKTLRAENLTSTYGEKTLFKDVSFIINEQDRIGLIGTNGSGKTSLLTAIAGAGGYKGRLRVEGPVAVSRTSPCILFFSALRLTSGTVFPL